MLGWGFSVQAPQKVPSRKLRPELCPPAPATWWGLDGLQLGVREAEDRGEAVTLDMT